MAKFRLAANAELDLLTKQELDESLQDSAAHEWAERGRGIKRLRFAQGALASVGTSTGYTIAYTPKQGYLYNIRLVSVVLSTAQTTQFYIGSDTSTGLPSPNTLPGLGAAASGLVGALTFGSGQAWLAPGDYVVIGAGGSATLNSYLLEVVETPAELAWKLV